MPMILAVGDQSALGFLWSAFFGGFIGAALSVLLDRLFRRYERIVRLTLYGVVSSDHSRQSVSLTIIATNVGQSNIPPSRLCVSTPKGTYILGKRRLPTDSEVWGPGQEEEFEYPLAFQGRFMEAAPKMIGDCVLLPEADQKKIALQLVKEKSNVVLYENKKYGRALARIMAKIVEEQRKPDAKWNDDYLNLPGLGELRHEPSGFYAFFAKLVDKIKRAARELSQ